MYLRTVMQSDKMYTVDTNNIFIWKKYTKTFFSIIGHKLGYMNRTSSMPQSVLLYVLDKGQYFDPKNSFTQSCFPNKKTDR